MTDIQMLVVLSAFIFTILVNIKLWLDLQSAESDIYSLERQLRLKSDKLQSDSQYRHLSKVIKEVKAIKEHLDIEIVEEPAKIVVKGKV